MQKYCSLSARCPIGVFFGVFILGILFWGAFNTSLELTNNETFCISCHEMRNNVYVEYKDTIHYKNRTGVRATCPDCYMGIAHKVARDFDKDNLLHDSFKQEKRPCADCHKGMA